LKRDDVLRAPMAASVCAILRLALISGVLAPFFRVKLPRAMPGTDKLTPGDPRDLAISIALALTSGSRLAKQSAEVLPRIVAERVQGRLALRRAFARTRAFA
jgi:hypothetical protein